MRNLLLLVVTIAFVQTSFAQEVLLPPGNQHLFQPRFSSSQYKSKAVSEQMPYLEDFSSTRVYPDKDRFADSSVYVGSSFAVNPLTIGVAMFDGLDASGNIYAHGSSFPFGADSLTSFSIRTDSVFTGTPHESSAADSIYFSFFYQPQGLGEMPDEDDSLLLEFYNASTSSWMRVWAASGSSFSTFQNMYPSGWKCVMIPITDAAFLSSDFRYRFRNYASYADLSFPSWASNADFWNVDYIYIDSDRDKSDTVPSDLAFRNTHESLLKNHYSMPWNHFLANTSAEMAESITIPYKNYSASLLNVTERLVITDLSGTTATYNSGLSAANLVAGADTNFYRNPVPYTFNSLVAENAEFLVQMAINTATISDPEKENDSIAFYQRFYNYFASDDGTAEAGYGLSISGAKAALRFDLNIADTIRSVQMFFNRTLNNANQIYFYLTLWDDQGGVPGNVLYEQAGTLPEFSDGLYQFFTYILDEPLAVNGPVYVGWEQTTDDVLNLGFDRNTNHSDRFFYNVDGNWYNTLYEGTPMIRIIVGDNQWPWAGVEETTSTQDMLMYPNPGGHEGIVFFSDPSPKLVTVTDLNGSVVLQTQCADQIETSSLKPGFYLFRIEQAGCQPLFVKWIRTY